MAGRDWLSNEDALLKELHAAGYAWGAMEVVFHSRGFNDRTEEGIRAHAKALDLLARKRKDILVRREHVVAPSEDIAGASWPMQKQLLLRENTRLQKKIQKLSAGNEMLVEAMETALIRLPPVVVPPFQKKSEHRPEVAMLDISDVHGGEVVRPEDVAGLGGYSFDTCLSYMDTLRKATLSIANIQRTGGVPLPKLVINWLGDIVTNENLFIGQGRSIDRTLVDQIFQLAHHLVHRIIRPFCEHFPEVVSYCVWGNHGRLGKKGEFHQRTNADYILYRAIEMAMRGQPNHKMYISQCPFLGYHLPEDPSRPHLITHGDQVRSWMSLPYYGLARYDARMISLTQILWSYTHIGHHHTAASIDTPHGERLMNGSWPGGDNYSIGRLQVANQPRQMLRGFSPKRGLTWSYPIYLGERPKLEFNEEGIATPTWREGNDSRLR